MTSARTWWIWCSGRCSPDRPSTTVRTSPSLAAQRWPTWIPQAEFQRVTGAARFPPSLAGAIKDGRLEYFANTLVSYTIRGVHAKLNVIWDWEAPAGAGDTHYAVYRGSRARVEVRQTRADRFVPELYVVPATAEMKPQVLDAVRAKSGGAAARLPRHRIEDRGPEIRLTIPDALRWDTRRTSRRWPRNFSAISASADPASVGTHKHAGQVRRHDHGDGRPRPTSARSRVANAVARMWPPAE